MVSIYRLLIIIVFALPICGNIMAQGKARKPRLVVVPSDALMNQMGLLSYTDDMGETSTVRDYQKAFFNTDLKGCIAKISEMFNDRGFPLTMLENELKRAQGGMGLTIPIDIRLELNYQVKRSGPRTLLYFELTGVDNYSSKQIAGTSGESAPAIGESVVNLLQEAVLSQIDKFSSDLQTYFEGMIENGRESRLTIVAENGASMDDDLNGQTIADIVEEWLISNCVAQAYSVDSQDETSMQISQAMMPLFSGNGNALDAYRFYRPLANKLRTTLSSNGYTIRQKRSAATSNSLGGTLGDAVITIERNSDEDNQM